MSFESLLTQSFTYWPPGTPDGYGSQSFGLPQTLLCRWQHQVSDQVDLNGEEFTGQAIIYSTAELLLNGFVFEGISTNPDPLDVSGSFELKTKARSQNPGGGIVVWKYVV